MLFNSYEFIFVFLPVVLATYFLLGRFSRGLSLAWIVIASLAFYAWWRPINVLIITTSLLVNFTVAYHLSHYSAIKSKAGMAKILLILGIVFNVCFLGYFKYINFARETLNEYAGTDFVLTQVILPLGISFITFQKIAFLIDVHSRRVKSFNVREFILFVLFFPQLIAGPIVHFREMIPQFKSNTLRFDSKRLSVGMSLFVFGLFKKVVFADGIAAYVTPIYELAASGEPVTFFLAWMAGVGFTLQMYFDFSGYSDMAAGLALCFGVRLPLNFDSPLKASNIIDFWARWHITLTRFLTAYVYNPLALWLTRRRMQKGLGGFGVKNTSLGAFIQILAFPTVATMALSGLWHGAGLLFILWGIVHGFYLVIDHAWRITGPKRGDNQSWYANMFRPAGFTITFFSVVVAMVLFRSTTGEAAAEILRGMIGLNGAALPAKLVDVSASVGDLFSTMSVGTPLASATEFVVAHCWLVGLLAVALIAPNTAELMYQYHPVLEEKSMTVRWWPRALNWSPNLMSAIFVSILAATAIMRMVGRSEFLYWQF